MLAHTAYNPFRPRIVKRCSLASCDRNTCSQTMASVLARTSAEEKGCSRAGLITRLRLLGKRKDTTTEAQAAVFVSISFSQRLQLCARHAAYTLIGSPRHEI